LVTHEEDIAMHAHRIVRMRDGLVENDYLNTNIQKVDRNNTTLKELVEEPTKEGQVK
jgi:putative ABC transport system ATP-binding protein